MDQAVVKNVERKNECSFIDLSLQIGEQTRQNLMKIKIVVSH